MFVSVLGTIVLPIPRSTSRSPAAAGGPAGVKAGLGVWPPRVRSVRGTVIVEIPERHGMHQRIVGTEAAGTDAGREAGLEGGVTSPCVPGCPRVEQQQDLASAEHDVQVAIVVLHDKEPRRLQRVAQRRSRW